MASRARCLSMFHTPAEMRGLVFAGDDADFDFLEAGVFEPMLQVALREAEPVIAVEFAGFFEIVFEQVEDHHLSPAFDDAMHALEGGGGFNGVMQGLA